MPRCQHCMSAEMGLRQNGHIYCAECGRAKFGNEKSTIRVKRYKHKPWTESIISGISCGMWGLAGDVMI